jgi:hypothetical protein
MSKVLIDLEVVNEAKIEQIARICYKVDKMFRYICGDPIFKIAKAHCLLDWDDLEEYVKEHFRHGVKICMESEKTRISPVQVVAGFSSEQRDLFEAVVHAIETSKFVVEC